MHPWFRMVNPDLNTLGSPTEDTESIRPPLPEELDMEIVLHMRWLLAPGPSHSDPDSKEVFDEELLLHEIEEKLTNNEENMEKMFYRLLSQHKTEILENYSGDENESRPGELRRKAQFNCANLFQYLQGVLYHMDARRWTATTRRLIPKLCRQYSIARFRFQSSLPLSTQLVDPSWITPLPDDKNMFYGVIPSSLQHKGDRCHSRPC